MNKVCWFIGFMLCCYAGNAQTLAQKLITAVQQLEADSQMRHAILGFAVADAKTGKIVFERNSQVGLAPASTQKIFTSAASFELLGRDYRYKTQLGYDGKIETGILNGGLHIAGSGDPTLGSWRYNNTKDSIVLEKWVDAVRKKGITSYNGSVSTYDIAPWNQSIQDGWIWQDIGNYYGAGARQVNWKENQYDIILRSGNNIGDTVEVVRMDNKLARSNRLNLLRSAAKGSGDNAYVYLPVGPEGFTLLKGTIPVGEKSFSISAAMVDPGGELTDAFTQRLARSITLSVRSQSSFQPGIDALRNITYFYTHFSPPLDSINYWFMRRSINLYGEALIKTIAHEKTGFGSTDTGVRIVRDFWTSKGIDKAAVNIIDGSGLSPQNRVTADALVKALLYARSRPWYGSFYEAMPMYNGMKLKSGSIGGARAFAGYHTSSGGKEYITAIMVNNYAGSSGDIVKKLYKVLDALK